ncbi:MAG: hypothetical protein RJA19_844 [Bacteroidota bacterium]
MKRIVQGLLLVLCMVSGVEAAAQKAGVAWMSLEEAIAAQAKAPRKIMIDVYTSWCGPCKMMMANTFTDPEVIAYLNANYYAVKFDAESPQPVNFRGQTFTNPGYRPGVTGRNSPHQLAGALGVTAYPTLVYLDEKGEIIAPITGYKTPPQLEMYLKFFAEHWTRSTVQSEWEKYRDGFQPTF